MIMGDKVLFPLVIQPNIPWQMWDVALSAPVGTRMWLPPRQGELCVRSRSFSQLCSQGLKLPSSGTHTALFLKDPGVYFSGAAGIGLEGCGGYGGGGKRADFPKLTLEVCGMSAAVLPF